ncbi:hypothetical protein GCM10020295_37730 [Streptomyces cinereospinus]
MLLGRTTRTAASGIDTLRAISTGTKILHVTCWGLSDGECQELAHLVSEADVEIQFSPVVLDERAPAPRGQIGPGLSVAAAPRRRPAWPLFFNLSGGYRAYLDELRYLQLPPAGGERWSCRSATAYVSTDGYIRRCPYGQASVSVNAPRAAIRYFLTAPAQDRVTPDCAGRRGIGPPDGVVPPHAQEGLHLGARDRLPSCRRLSLLA